MRWFNHIYTSLSATERKIAYGAAFIVAGGTVFLIVTAFLSNTTVVPAEGGNYIEGMAGQPTFVNPILAKSEVDKDLVRLLFAPFSEMTEGVEAEKSRVNREWRVRLKEDLKWHDGRKITSDDVIFTIQRIVEPDSASRLAATWQGITVNRLSELEVQFILPSPYSFFPDLLKNLYLVPKHALADIPTNNWKLSDYSLKPIGSGPYKVGSVEQRSDGFISGYRLVPADTYFAPHAFIQNFQIRFYPNFEDLTKAFNEGYVDGWISADQNATENVKRPFNLVRYPTEGYYAVFFNPSRQQMLKDAAVRKALVLSVDRKALIEKMLSGAGTPVYGPIPKIDGEMTQSYSPSDAARVLENAGWTLNSEGVRERGGNAAKTPLHLTLAVPQISALSKIAPELVRQWATVGIKVQLLPVLSDGAIENTVKNRDYDMLLYGNNMGESSDIYAFWHSSQRFYPGFNLSVYNDRTVDALIEAARQESDADARSKKLRELQNAIVSDAPALFLYSPSYFYVTGKNLKGVQEEKLADAADRFARVAAWYVKTARVFEKKEPLTDVKN